MSLATCSRSRAPTLRALSRYYSSDKSNQVSKSSSPTKVLSHTTLPPAKLRALIALYHQADSWITRENLEEKIDKAFVPDPAAKHKEVLDVAKVGAISVEALDRFRRHFRVAPKMAQWNKSLAYDSDGSNWEFQLSKREAKVIEALYGVDAPVDNTPRPGLELLQDNADNLPRDPKEVEHRQTEGQNS